ncbi:MAG: hypothetical protein AB7I30_13625 [Isosphaeraceae bacterium]
MWKFQLKTSWCVVLVIAATGCEGKPSVSTSKTEVTVTGTVTLHGKKATRGEIVFDPANYLRANESVRTAPISKDGTYSIRTLTGQNMVRVQTPEVMKTRDEPPQLPVEVEKEGQVFDVALP